MDFFENVSLFSSLSLEERLNLSCFCQLRDLKKWEILFNEWEEGNSMYVLKTWTISVEKEKNWKNVKLWIIESEDILWEMSLFWNSHKRMASAIVLEDSTLITILSFSLKELFFKNPELHEKIKSIVLEREKNNEIVLK